VSTSIKPPTGSTPGLAGLEGAPDIKANPGVQGPSAQGASPQASVTAASPQVGSPSEGWLNRLQAGEVTRDQAIDGLVNQALENHDVSHLPSAQRTALEQVLRATLLDDPVLSRLLGDA